MESLKLSFLFPLLFIVSTVFAQQDKVQEQKEINELTKAANALIWHVNLNENKLIVFQQELNMWNTNPIQYGKAPSYTFSSTVDYAFYNTLSSTANTSGASAVFNYKKALLSLYSKVMAFDVLCKQITNQKVTKNYYQNTLALLKEIDIISKEFVDLSYDFSLASAINFGKAKMPEDLLLFKNIVGQSKNVIMGMRNDNMIQLKSYLSLLNAAISASNKLVNMNTLRREGAFRISTAAIDEKKQEITTTANQIAFWAEQYIQSNQTDEDKEVFLYNAVEAFNSSTKKLGSAGTYNNLVATSSTPFLAFTEEPLPFSAAQSISKVVVSNEALEEENIFVKESAIENPIIAQEIETESFDAKNENSLAGAKVNNIVFLMDVSPSMLSTGKFPLLKTSLLHLLNIMRPQDRISLVAYSGEAKLLYENAGIKDKAAVKLLLDTLESSGGTDLENGLKIAYEVAQKAFKEGENNKVIIASDGQFGVNAASSKMVEIHAFKDIFLSVLQITDNTESSAKPYLQNLTDKGRGYYRMMSNSAEAKTQLMKEVKVR